MKIPRFVLFLMWSLCLTINFANGAGAQTAAAKATDQKEALWDADQLNSLKSFKKINDHPLFEMTLHGDYKADKPLEISALDIEQNTLWACSIFVSYGENGEAKYGRNFDWYSNPAMMLHTDPSDGYVSISIVDISYLGFANKDEKYDSLAGREALLNAWSIPFDGMNEHGLTVAMAAVGEATVPNDKEKITVGSLQIIRLMLDKAKTVDEALKLFDKYNIAMSGGPHIHYLIADADGNSALVELKDGKVNVLRNKSNWQSATNFYLTGEGQPVQQCWRFAKINKEMNVAQGILNTDQTFNLLKNVAQENTQWSVVYDLKNRKATVVTDRKFEKRFEFDVK
jgi:hypothetical protein